MINIPIAKPTNAALNRFTLLKYSGDRKSEFAPNFSRKCPLIVANNTYQKIKNI